MVPVPSSTFGSFFDGDCYIVLAVSWGWAQEGLRTAKVSGSEGQSEAGGGKGAGQLHPWTASAGCTTQVPPKYHPGTNRYLAFSGSAEPEIEQALAALGSLSSHLS